MDIVGISTATQMKENNPPRLRCKANSDHPSKQGKLEPTITLDGIVDGLIACLSPLHGAVIHPGPGFDKPGRGQGPGQDKTGPARAESERRRAHESVWWKGATLN